MKLNRVLVIVKPSSLDQFGGRRARGKAAPSFKLTQKHADALESVMRDLESFKLPYQIEARDSIKRASGVDLIIPVGGDGTFLAASHIAHDVPLLGVNPDPTRSVGFFCAAVPKTFSKVLKKIISEKLLPIELPLIETKIKGRMLPVLALNDVLFAAASPAESACYYLIIGKKRERQKSSGVWISAGPGSTAAMSSAGGKPLSISSRKLEYLVREPCPLPSDKYRLLHGILKEGSQISIESAMKRGKIYIDGHWLEYPVSRGAKVTCRLSRKTLKLFM